MIIIDALMVIINIYAPYHSYGFSLSLSLNETYHCVPVIAPTTGLF